MKIEGGYATRDEMCFAFITFYPRFPDSMTLCIAGPQEEVLADAMRARREPLQGIQPPSPIAKTESTKRYGSQLTLLARSRIPATRSTRLRRLRR